MQLSDISSFKYYCYSSCIQLKWTYARIKEAKYQVPRATIPKGNSKKSNTRCSFYTVLRVSSTFSIKCCLIDFFKIMRKLKQERHKWLKNARNVEEAKFSSTSYDFVRTFQNDLNIITVLALEIMQNFVFVLKPLLSHISDVSKISKKSSR